MCVSDFSEIRRLRAAGDRRLPYAEVHKNSLSAFTAGKGATVRFSGSKKEPDKYSCKSYLARLGTSRSVTSYRMRPLPDFWSCAKIKSYYSVVSSARYFSIPTMALHRGHLSLVSICSVIVSSVTTDTRGISPHIRVVRSFRPHTGQGIGSMVDFIQHLQ